MKGSISVSYQKFQSNNGGDADALPKVLDAGVSEKRASIRQASSSTSAKSPPNPETLSRPHQAARVSTLKDHEMVIERSNSMVIVEDFQHDRQRAIVTVLVGALSGLSLVSALAAMYIEASIPAYVAFAFPLFVAPLAIHQRSQINKLPTLRSEIQRCRDQVSRLATENVRLHVSINSLTAQVQRLAPVDDQLRNVARRNNEDVTTLRMLIYTNAILQRQMSRAMQARDLQHLLTTLLACDADKNNFVSSNELDHVLVRLEAFGTRIPREVLKTALVQAAMPKGASTTSLFHGILNTDPSLSCGGLYIPLTD
jgi:hypothetical protein